VTHRTRRTDGAGTGIRRRRLGADAHCRSDANADARIFRTVERAQLGSVAGRASHRRLRRASVPAVRSRRLRRRQGIRVPDDAIRRAHARRFCVAVERNGGRKRLTLSGLMRLAIVRQRYTPYGGAERFIENALEALLERNVAITLYTREWPETNLQLM